MWKKFQSIFLPNIQNYIHFKTIFPKELVCSQDLRNSKILSQKLSIKNLATMLKCNVFKNQTFNYCTFLHIWKQIYFESWEKTLGGTLKNDSMNLQNKKAGLLLQNDGKYPWALALYEEKWSVSTQKFSVPNRRLLLKCHSNQF